MTDLGETSTSFAVPQHPLPEEIQNMERDETVCKFCGVSYLIHNEVKALQDRVAEAERQMEYYKGSIEREKVLKGKLEEMDLKSMEQSRTLNEQAQQLELFKSDLKMKSNLINGMFSEKHRVESELQKVQSKSESLKTQIGQLSATLPKLNGLLRQQKESLNNLRKEATKEQTLFENNMNCMRDDLEKAVYKVVEKVKIERKAAEIKWNGMNEQLQKSQVDISNFRAASSKIHDLQTKSGDLENKVTTYQRQINELQEQNKTLREKTYAIEKELQITSSDARKIRNNMESLQNEKQHEVLQHEETVSKKDYEIKRLNALCKSLEKLMNERSAAEIEVRQKVTGKDLQLKTLEESLSKAKEESAKLQVEREQTIVAHHDRIEQLRESYKKKLGEADKSYGELQKEFEELQEKLRKEMKEEKFNLRHTFEKEREAMNIKHAEQLNVLQAQVKCLNEKLENETRICQNYEEEISQLKNTLSLNKTKNAQDVQRYQNNVLDLKAKLEDLQQRVKIQDQRASSEETAAVKLKYQTTHKSLLDSSKQVKLLEQELMNCKNEMTILQDTVRRECEERLELTQALSDARIQLLSSQSPVVSRDSPSAKNHSRVVNRPSLTKHSDFKHSSISEVNTTFVNVGYERKVKSTGSETSRPTRESVDSFRERIAAALGRQSRSNHTR